MLDLHRRCHPNSPRHRPTKDPHSPLPQLTLKLFEQPIRIALVVICWEEPEILSTILHAVVVSSSNNNSNSSSSNIMATQLPIVLLLALPQRVFHTTQPHPHNMAVMGLLLIILPKVILPHRPSHLDNGRRQVRIQIRIGPKGSRVRVIFITPTDRLSNSSLLIPVLGVMREYLFKKFIQD